MRALVTGATGFVGTHLVPELVRAGYEVRCLVRPTSDRRALKGLPVEFVLGDVTDADACRRAVREVDVVFHLAGLTKALRRDEFFTANVGGTANLIGACAARESPPRVVVVSSLAAAGPAADGMPDEDSPCAPITPYGESKLAAERVVEKWRNEVPATVVRPPLIYGPYDRESLSLFRLARLGLCLRIPGLRRLSYVEVSDLVAGLLRAATIPRAVGRTYYLASPEPCTQVELLQLIGKAVGRRGIAVPAPAMVVLGAGIANGWVARLRGRPHIFDRHKARDMVARHWVCSARRAAAELGFVAKIPLAEGLRRTAEWYRERGWL